MNGESEFAFEIFNWGIINSHAVQATIQKENNNTAIAELSVVSFFENYINRLTATADAMMLKDITRYRALQNFIANNFATAKVYRCGATKIAVYIVCHTAKGDVWVLKTYSIET